MNEAEPNIAQAPGGQSPVPASARMAAWFRLLLGILFLLVVVGGTVRLTGSGMSIPHWPLIDYSTDPSVKEYSLLPPMNEAQWERISDVYHTLVVRKNDPSITLPMSQVKREFYIEYSHRAVAGFFGIVFLAVIVQVAVNAEVRRRIGLMLIASVVVLASQIVLGGHVVLNHTHPLYVSTHLITAFVFISLIQWMAMTLGRPEGAPSPERAPALVWLPRVAAAVCLVQIFLGGIVAKTGAGKFWNTWPQMGEGGPVVPPAEALFMQEPWYRNFLENLMTVQFVHRWFAFAVLVAVFVLVAKLMARPLTRGGRWALRGVSFIVVFQIMLGILTLLKAVPYFLGILHLATGLALFQLLVALTFEVRHNAAIHAARPVLAAEPEEDLDAHPARVS